MGVKKNSIFIFLVVLILTGSVLMGYKVGEVARKEIINAQDVLHTFQIGGITFKPETSLYPKEYKVKDTEPIIYKDSQGNLLFIYTFGSFVERQRNFLEEERSDWLPVTLDKKTYLSKHYRVKNLHLVHLIADPSKANTQVVHDFLKKADRVEQLIFTDLNGGEEIFFTGESPSWEAKVVVRYYEHWWTDSENARRYEGYSEADATTFTYKGQIPEQAIPIEYSIITRSSDHKSTREITPEMLRSGITLSGGSVAMPRENDAYAVKITLDGQTEEFELKPSNMDDR